jgi:hypothetical protein
MGLDIAKNVFPLFTLQANGKSMNKETQAR